MFHPLPTPAEMADWDRQAMDIYGLRGDMLMENAARAAVDVLLAEVHCRSASILVLAGPGNNGGDGFAMARRLQDMGACPVVVHTRPKKNYRGAARQHLHLAQRVDVPMHYLPRFDFSTLPAPVVVIDALLGTGFSGTLRKEMLALVQRINAMNSFTLAVDCPTGLNAKTGLPQPEAVRADMTATMHAIKLGMALPHAAPYTGRVRVCEIGIPMQVAANTKAAHQLIGPEILHLAPRTEPDMHKGTAGRVLIIGGSAGLTGAPHLAALGALRSGAGYATIASPAAIAAQVKHDCPDIMTMPLGSGRDWSPAMAQEILTAQHGFDAVVIGPGLGRAAGAAEFLSALYEGLQLPSVLDADALYHLAKTPAEVPKQTILTPHPGEMALLSGVATAAVQADRFRFAQALAARHKAVVILKGAGSIVAAPNRETYLCSLSAPNLAIAGSGDVLSGLLGALLARGISTLPGACIGVYWHGLAGKSLAKEFPERGNLASEIAHCLPLARKEQTC